MDEKTMKQEYISEDINPLMVSEHMQALKEFPLNRSMNSFRWHHNPILEAGTAGEWDDALIRDPMIFYDNTAPVEEKFKLYYSGKSSVDGKVHIGLAYGSSLEKLTKYPGNPVVEMTEEWEKVPHNHNPYVIQVPGTDTFEMVYTAITEKDGVTSFSIGRVLSNDGKTWTDKKQVFKPFKLGKHVYSIQKPILNYNVEEGKYNLIFSGTLMKKLKQKNEGFTGLACSDDGEKYTFEKLIIPQDVACSIYDAHGLVTIFGWYFLLVTHDPAHAFDCDGNDGYPERWLVSKNMRDL